MSESPAMTAVERRAERFKTAIEKQARNVEIRRAIGQVLELIAIERAGRPVSRWPLRLTEKRLTGHPQIDRHVLVWIDQRYRDDKIERFQYCLTLAIAKKKGDHASSGVFVKFWLGQRKGRDPIEPQLIRESNPLFFPGPEADGRLIAAIGLGKHVDWAAEAIAIEGRTAALQAEMATFGVNAAKNLIHPEEETAL